MVRAHYETVLSLLASYPDRDIPAEKIVHVLRPAGWFSRHVVTQFIPAQDTERWVKEPESRAGWILRGVVDAPQHSVTQSRGEMLLLDDARYVRYSYYSQWAENDEGLFVPGGNLVPLQPRSLVDMRLVQLQLEERFRARG